jgi:hypothetical protein
MTHSRLVALAFTACVALVGPARTDGQAAKAAQDPWRSVRFMVGEWEGESEGEPGNGSIKRSYRFVLKDRFLEEHNVSTYPAQPKNPKGEVHEHRSFISHDRARKTLVFRQFHQEGFVNQYAMEASAADGRIVFVSEALENVPAGWKARETYEVVSPDEFVETFELSADGKPFSVYSKARFRRGQAARAGGGRPVTESKSLLQVRHVSVSIGRPPDAVYAFAATIENLPKWAAGLSKTLRNVNGEWIVDGPVGTVKVRFSERNTLGVLDHDVVLPSGAVVHNAIRVVPNGTGSEVTFVLLRQPGVTDAAFEDDARAVERDLRTLKALLE